MNSARCQHVQPERKDEVLPTRSRWSLTSPVRNAVLLIAGVTAGLVACSSSEPELPSSTEPSAVHQFLTDDDATSALQRISTYDWPDEGARTATYFDWIGPDATSSDPAVATRAGESAHAIATFLADKKSELGSISPKLVAAYAAALTPFQAAMVGDDEGVHGFGTLGQPEDLSSAHAVFDVIATNPEAGRQFVDSAYDRAAAVAADAARKGCRDKAVAAAVGPPAVRTAAALSGLAASADEQVDDRKPPLDDIVHAMAIGCLSVAEEPPRGRITDYIENGKLMPPEDVLRRDKTLEAYYQSQRDYVANQGLSTADFYDWWRKAFNR